MLGTILFQGYPGVKWRPTAFWHIPSQRDYDLSCKDCAQRQGFEIPTGSQSKKAISHSFDGDDELQLAVKIGTEWKRLSQIYDCKGVFMRLLIRQSQQFK